MESNKDEALKCLAIAQRRRDAGDLPGARRFCQKSLALFSTPEATKLLNAIEADTASADSAEASSSSSSAGTPVCVGRATPTYGSAAGSGPKANGNAAKGAEEVKRDYTPEQAAVVKRVRACKVTEYYEILSVKKDCEEAEIKKAYRKLALSLHPDKNGAPGADEAFKSHVPRSHHPCIDPQKRAVYDQHGSDPESRFSGMSSAGRAPSGFATTNGFRGGGFEGEISPEDLFNMFFGGGGGQFGGGFGGGPVFSASFGPGGFRTTNVRTNMRQAPPQAAEQRSTFFQLLPLILLFAVSFLNFLPNLFGTPATPDPRFSFSPSMRYNMERQTGGLGVKYHVNSGEFSGHPVAAELARNGNKPGPELSRFEKTVEQVFTQDLYSQCQRGLDVKQRKRDQELGLFGLGTDWEKVKRIEAEPVPSCEQLKSMGLIK
ncbi:DnaJ domain-containing protein [Fomitopsis serialis]|uniref:DnaJ domain-containing protein n=1 Tax=Fomitopsis serialis TaxID=139415 RepID=UPI002008670B|nr:DnaJ domain-containing protein [Neoantrodia serialis]KAH9913928.1 DnaJ domain-containing protein [Neoantrodia serialis]